MLLAIDIGNTTISIGVFKSDKIRKIYEVSTHLNPSILRKSFGKVIQRMKREQIKVLDDIVICSVVPAALKILEPLLKKEFAKKPIIIGRDVIVPIINRYKNPKQVGQDRLVGAYAAMQLYGIPVIIVDLGTAITLDIVSKNKEYLGGIIVPGIKLSADALFQKAALLPLVRIHKPRTLIGKDTETSILSGIFFGYGEMIRGLVTLIARRTNTKPKVVVTGGYTALMKNYIKNEIDNVDEILVFKGIYFLWEYYKKIGNEKID